MIEFEEYEKILSLKQQLIFYGPPGTGKTKLAKELATYLCSNKTDIDEYNRLQKEEQITLMQLHPSYTYEDFVRGIEAEVIDGQVHYTVKNKILMKMSEKAKENKEKKYVLILDEINRANLVSVFGELIYALEYRGEEIHSMYELEGSYTIELPKNLYIIGTMNTADRSLGHLDYALRRRFAFYYVKSNKEVITNKRAKELYELIEKIMEDEHTSELELDDIMIGHSYFLVENENELELRFEYEIKPLLLDYIKDGILKHTARNKIENLNKKNTNE